MTDQSYQEMTRNQVIRGGLSILLSDAENGTGRDTAIVRRLEQAGLSQRAIDEALKRLRLVLNQVVAPAPMQPELWDGGSDEQ